MKKYLSYNEWRKIGKHVKKGQKSICKNEAGEALFSAKQVEAYGFKPHYDDNVEGYDYEGSWEEIIGGEDAFEHFRDEQFFP